MFHHRKIFSFGFTVLAAGWIVYALAGDSSPAKKATTIALVRHAEKLSEGDDPGLTKEGEQRAERLAKIFQRAKVDFLVASDWKRTKETLKPLAREKKLEVTSFSKAPEVLEKLKSLPPGSCAVVAHHSSTLPEIVSGLGVPAERVKEIDFESFDNLFLVTRGESIESQLLNLSF